MSTAADLPTFTSLDELIRLVTRRRCLCARWSRGPDRALTDVSSTDDLTGVTGFGSLG